VKSPLYGDVSEKTMMGMIYPFSVGTLTFVRTIETFVEIFCHQFFSFGEDELLKREVSLSGLRQALKTSLSRISATGKLSTCLCLNGHKRCYGYQKCVFE
jgi:hypothetical protein